LKLLAPVVLTLVVLSPCVVPAAAGQQNVLPPPSSIYGHSYQEWAAAWWQWALTQPVATNPVLDEDGRNCAAGQIGPVWFLAGTFQSGVRVERSCEVPAGTALFFPVVNSFYCAIAAVDPPETRTEAYARSQVSFVRDAANGLVATIDGVAVPNIKPRYFEESVLFDVVLPADNLFELDPGTLLDPCVDAGYYLMLHPLSVGEHTIAFSGSLGAFTIDVEYTITVVGGRR
jgi:hypothetical protein